MKSQKIHKWFKQRIANSLPENCSWCDKEDSSRWTPLLLCENDFIDNHKHFILCKECYEYYDKAEANYRFWIERQLSDGGFCTCSGV